MKKNRKRILAILMAAAVLTTSGMPVYASGADSVTSTELETPVVEREIETVQATEDTGDSTNRETAGNAVDEVGSTEENSTTQGVSDAEDADDAVETESLEGTGSAAGADGIEETGSTVEENETAETEENNTVLGDIIVDENNDEVEIKENDKPYLSLGADLTEEQRAIVLSIMGIDPANLGDYDVVYVTNEEEHQYLDAYVDASKIGSKSWSSVVIVEREKGNGLNISTNNISYCTVGMYKNALTTAGVTDADIIVAGPQRISGTAALVGIIKAYQEMTGEEIDDSIVDAALNELVITGELADSIAGLTNEEVEEFIAYIKAVIAENDLSDEESINEAIDDACEKYGVTLTDEERQKIVDLLLKITSLGIDLDGLVDYAASLYDSFKNGGNIGGDGILSSIGNFFAEVFSSIGDFFKNLFS